jgi:lauroyl/myristoyl acyltransferase
MDETQKKIKRLQYWGIFLIIVGGISAYFLPEHSIQAFFGLLGDIAKMIMI